MARQVKSKQRVADHGEVFTADREVNAMLDLVKQETERVDSRFLEPACGDGNFLAEILRRKLEAAKKRAIPPRKKKPLPLEFEKQSVIAVASIYGVDLKGYGLGQVKGIDGAIIVVTFDGIDKKFQFPGGFENGFLFLTEDE